MLIMESYKDLLGEIELLKWLHDDSKRQLKRNQSDCWGHDVPLPKALAEYDNIIERMGNIEREIDHKQLLARRIQERIQQFTGIDYTVAYMRDIRGMSLDEIADETSYSYGYVKKISSRTSKMRSQRENHEIAK